MDLFIKSRIDTDLLPLFNEIENCFCIRHRANNHTFVKLEQRIYPSRDVDQLKFLIKGKFLSQKL